MWILASIKVAPKAPHTVVTPVRHSAGLEGPRIMQDIHMVDTYICTGNWQNSRAQAL